MKPPSKDELDELAIELGLGISDDELEDYAKIVANRLTPLENVIDTPQPQSPPRDYSYTNRPPGYQPSENEDPHNAWITKCQIQGANNGPLTGLSVGLKDNISVAGIELTNGSRVIEGYIPTIDATVVTRLLDAGATIEGKNNMWSFSVGASDYGTVQNPNAPEYSIGGSSSGTAAAVASGDIDIGMGGDQGGSVRIPSSLGGLVGLKPTHGLVPYTGIFGADASIDHTGPITRTVKESALAMEVLAGRDGLDPRQPHDLEVQDYMGALDENISDLTVAVLEEGFDHDRADQEVLSTVRDAITDLEALGATVTEVSIPEHFSATGLTLTIVRYGYGQLLEQNGIAVGSYGWHDTAAAEHLSRVLTARSKDLPPTQKAGLLVSEYVRRNYGASVYGKAQNLAAIMRNKYNDVLTDVDVLVMPTIPIKPPEYSEERGIKTLLDQGTGSSIANNTLPFNSTHHPAMTVPCGEVDRAPVGMMLVAERFDEATLFTLAHAYEQYRVS